MPKKEIVFKPKGAFQRHVEGKFAWIDKEFGSVRNEFKKVHLEFKKVREEMKQEIRNVGALIEQTNGYVRAIAEQYRNIRHDISEIRVVLDSHTEMIGDLALDMAFVKEELKNKADINHKHPR